MKEVMSNSVDLIVGSPPYNIGTRYAENKDLTAFNNFKKMLDRIYSECFRVLKKDGTMIVELADTVFTEGSYVELAGLVQSLCLKKGFILESRHINFAMSHHHVEGLEHDWNSDYTTKHNAHSNCHQILVFRKGRTKWKEGKILYFNYASAEGHPCPTPLGIYNFILENYFKKGQTVLDPFAGTARLGEATLKLGGTFIGYEISKKYSRYATNKLSKLNSSVGKHST